MNVVVVFFYNATGRDIAYVQPPRPPKKNQEGDRAAVHWLDKGKVYLHQYSKHSGKRTRIFPENRKNIFK